MTEDDIERVAGPEVPPTLALLGEFSAGKSTLANVLLGVSQSTVRVTATQAPPIWYVFGNGLPVLIGTDGSETELPTPSLADVSMEDTRAVRVPVQAEILEKISLIDMPGSSDPNMSPDVWDALLPLADIAIWCTPATQAWRQSEAAIWDMMPDALRERSVLLLTRMDKVASPTDRKRILTRIERETKGLFRAVLPVSLLNVSQPPALCDASGMSQVMRTLDGILSGEPVAAAEPVQPEPAPTAPPKMVRPHIVPRRISTQATPPSYRVLRRAPAPGRST